MMLQGRASNAIEKKGDPLSSSTDVKFSYESFGESVRMVL